MCPETLEPINKTMESYEISCRLCQTFIPQVGFLSCIIAFPIFKTVKESFLLRFYVWDSGRYYLQSILFLYIYTELFVYQQEQINK